MPDRLPTNNQQNVPISDRLSAIRARLDDWESPWVMDDHDDRELVEARG